MHINKHALSYTGRPIAVDWAVPKNKYERVTQMATGMLVINGIIRSVILSGVEPVNHQ